ncbi:MAG: polysulfide reductase NrfD [Thermoleophilia bacterium]
MGDVAIPGRKIDPKRAGAPVQHVQGRAAVGEVEEVSARYRRLLAGARAGEYAARPQETWGLEIAGYLYLGGLGAGAFAVAVILEWLGFGLSTTYAGLGGGRVWDWSKALLFWGPLAAAAGALLLILDLGRNWFLFFTAGRNPRTSWMARGFSILLSFIVTGCAVTAVSVLAPQSKASSLVLWRGVEAIAVASAVGTAFYTGMLLRSMSFIPAWNTLWLPLLFLASALSTGSMGVLIGSLASPALGVDPASPERLAQAIEVLEPALIVAEAVLLALYVRHLVAAAPEARMSAAMLLRGSWRYPFWVGVVGCSLALPLLLDVVGIFARSLTLGALTAVSVLVGGFVLRLAVLGVGVKERPPLYRFGEWRGRHMLDLRSRTEAEVMTRRC